MNHPAALSFDELISPLTPDRFFAEHYEQAPAIIHRGDPDHYKPLIDIAAIDRFLAGAEHYYPDVYLVNAAEPELKPQDYCGPGQRIDLRRLYDLFAKGATIVLFGIENRLPGLRSLCRAVEHRLSVACDSNVYLTPPGSHGLRPHYDNHDIFVLQVAGAKSWTLFDSPIPLPLPGQSFAQLKPEAGPVSHQSRLDAGDVLYCPRGLMHDAEAGDETSLHITLGLKGCSWTQLMIEAVAELALTDVEFRRLLPVGYAGYGWNREAARGDFRAHLQAHFHMLADRLATHTRADALIERQADAFVASRPPIAAGRIEALLAPPQIAADTRLGAWPDLIFRLVTEEEEEVRVVWQGPDLVLPSFTAPDLSFALTAAAFTIGDLPGELDEAGRLVLARRLCREGLLRVLPEDTQ